MSVGVAMQSVYARLKGDAALSSLLAVDPDSGTSAIYDYWGHVDGGPYITLDWTVGAVIDRIIEDGGLQVDIWDRRSGNQSRVPIMQVRDRVVALLDNWVSGGDIHGRLFKEDEAPQDESSSGVRRWRVNFAVRWGRSADIAANTNL